MLWRKIVVSERMLTPDVAPVIVTRRGHSVYSRKKRFLDTLPRKQSVRLTGSQKRLLFNALQMHTDLPIMHHSGTGNHPRMLKERLVLRKVQNKVRCH